MIVEGIKRSIGSALIIAFLLMAAISGVAFGIARLFYLDTSLGGIYEDSTVAYYAAESGIEEGLLRYRYNRNFEVAAETGSDYLNYDKVNRNNLVSGKVNPNITKSGLITSATDQIYDLNMYYKARFYGNDINGNGLLDKGDLINLDYGKEYTIPRDEAVKIDVSDVFGVSGSGDIMNILIQMKKFAPDFTVRNSFIEAKLTGYNIGGELKEYKKALIVNGTIGDHRSQGGLWDSDSCAEMNEVSFPYKIYKLTDLKSSILKPSGATLFDTNKSVFLYLKPIGCDIVIGIDPDDSKTISAPYTTVKSTGYYGGVGRTLTAKIDRQSGTVYDIFDFVVYQHL